MKTLRQFLSLTLVICCFCSCGNGTKKEEANEKKETPSAKNQDAPIIAAPKAEFDTLKDGDFTQRYANGIIRIKGFYVNGKRDGEWVSFFEDGKIQSEGFFRQGRRDGKGTVYYPSGKKMYEGFYKDGVMAGKWTYYNTDGSFNKEIDYDKDKGKK